MSQTLPTQEPTGAFTAEELQQFQHDGYVIARNIAPAALCDRLLEVAEDQLARHVPPLEYEADLHYPGAPESRAVRGGGTVRRLLRAQSRDYAFTEWVCSAPLLQRIKQLLGNHIIMPLAHHNCIMTKQPHFSSDTGWHQDTRYWSFQAPNLVNAWLALGPEREENGCMRLIPGSYKMDFERGRFDSQQFFRDDLPENRTLIDQQRTALLEPGDVLFFHARTLHAATRNFSDTTKFSVVFTFRSPDNPPLPGSRSSALPELLLP